MREVPCSSASRPSPSSSHRRNSTSRCASPARRAGWCCPSRWSPWPPRPCGPSRVPSPPRSAPPPSSPTGRAVTYCRARSPARSPPCSPRQGQRLPAKRPRPQGRAPPTARRVVRVRRRRPGHRARRHDRPDHPDGHRSSRPIGEGRRRRRPAVRDGVRPRRERGLDPRGRRRGPDRPVGAHPAVRRAARPCEVGGPHRADPRSRSARSSGTASWASSSPRTAGRWPSLVRLDRRGPRRSRATGGPPTDGPPFELTSMTMATGSIRLADQRPVDWLLP